MFTASAALVSDGSYRDVVVDDKPFAYYGLDEETPSQPVADEMMMNPGRLFECPADECGGAISTDKESKAVSFSWADKQYVQLTSLGDFGSSMTAGFTIEYWLKTANGSDYQTILGTANGPGFVTDFLVDISPPHSPTPVRVLTLHGAAGAKAIS